MKEEGRKAQTQSFMWLSEVVRDGLPEIILYGYSPTRSGGHAKEFLDGYSGYLETDGYQGYNHLPGIRRCSCWAHIRRYFIDTVPIGKQYDYSQPAVQGVHYRNRLFAIEDSINKKYPDDYEKRKQLRLEKENLFWMLSGRGSISKSQSGTPGWIRLSITCSIGVIQRRLIWKTGGAALPIISVKMQFVYSQ